MGIYALRVGCIRRFPLRASCDDLLRGENIAAPRLDTKYQFQSRAGGA